MTPPSSPSCVRPEPRLSLSVSYHRTRGQVTFWVSAGSLRDPGVAQCAAFHAATASSHTALSVVTVKQLGTSAGYGPEPSHTIVLFEQSSRYGCGSPVDGSVYVGNSRSSKPGSWSTRMVTLRIVSIGPYPSS